MSFWIETIQNFYNCDAKILSMTLPTSISILQVNSFVDNITITVSVFTGISDCCLMKHQIGEKERDLLRKQQFKVILIQIEVTEINWKWKYFDSKRKSKKLKVEKILQDICDKMLFDRTEMALHKNQMLPKDTLFSIKTSNFNEFENAFESFSIWRNIFRHLSNNQNSHRLRKKHTFFLDLYRYYWMILTIFFFGKVDETTNQKYKFIELTEREDKESLQLIKSWILIKFILSIHIFLSTSMTRASNTLNKHKVF